MPEARRLRDLFNREVGGLQQLLAPGDASIRQPRHRRRADFGTETPAERTRRHVRPSCERGHRVALVEVLLHPSHEDLKCLTTLSRGERGVDVLALATLAMRGNYHPTRDPVSDRRAIMLPDELQTGVDARRRPSARDDLFLEPIERVTVDRNTREGGLKGLGIAPVRGGAPPVQDAGLREGERPRAHAQNGGVPVDRIAQFAQNSRGGARRHRAPGDRDEIGFAAGLKTVPGRHADRAACKRGPGLLSAYREREARDPVSGSVHAKDLVQHAELERREGCLQDDRNRRKCHWNSVWRDIDEQLTCSPVAVCVRSRDYRAMSTSSLPSAASSPSEPASPTPENPRLGVLELAIAMTLSGTIGVFVIESQASPLTVAFARCAVGALALGLWCWGRGHLVRPNVTWPSLLLIVCGGLCLVANWVLLFASFQHTSIGVATVTYHVQPFLLVLFAPVVLREALAVRQLTWVALGFAGLVLIAQPWAEPLTGGYGRGMLEAVAAAALYALATLLVKRLTGVRPHVIALIQLSVGALVLFPLASLGELTTLEGLPWLLTLGIVHTAFMYVLVYDSYPRLTTPTIAFLGFLYPVVAVAFDAVVYGHVLSLAQLSGSLLILMAGLGRTLVHRPRPTADAAQHVTAKQACPRPEARQQVASRRDEAGEALMPGLVLGIERWRPEAAADIYARVRSEGNGLPPHVVVVGSWVDQELRTCWQIMAGATETDIASWRAHWADMMDIETVAVLPGAEVASLMSRSI